MGAWGEGLFENDSAGDLVAQVMHTEPDEILALIDATFDAVLDPDDSYLEVDQVAQGLAAVAFLVAERDSTVLPGGPYGEGLPGALATAGLVIDEERARRSPRRTRSGARRRGQRVVRAVGRRRGPRRRRRARPPPARPAPHYSYLRPISRSMGRRFWGASGGRAPGA